MKFLMVRPSEKEIPEAFGIYAIRTRYSRHVYIGSTFNFRDRFGKHLSKLIRKKHPNAALQQIFDRHHILFYCLIKRCSLVNITRTEQEFIDRYAGKSLNAARAAYYRRKTKP